MRDLPRPVPVRPRPVRRVSAAGVAALAAALALTPPPPGARAADLPPVAAPALPAPDGPAPPPASFVHARLTLPLAALRGDLERSLPSEIRPPGVVESVSPDEVLKDDEKAVARAGVRWRGPIHRGAIALAVRGDTLYATAPVRYRVAIEGEGFPPQECAMTGEPLAGEVRTATRFGWGPGWRLESRSWPAPTVYFTRCKPRPPAVNFTKLVNDRIEARFLSRLGPALDSLVAAVDLAPRAAALHGALAAPVALGHDGPWLAWNPGAVRAEWPRLEGDSLVVRLAIETAPRIAPTAGDAAAPFPEAPAPRLGGRDVHVPFDCWVDYAEMAGRLTGLALPAGATGADTVRVAAATVRGARDRLAVELELTGAVRGRAHLVGTLASAEPHFALELPDLDWSPDSRAAFARALPGDAGASLRAALDALAEQARLRLRFDLRPCVVRWDQALARSFAQVGAGETRLQAAFNRRRVSDVFCTDSAVGVRVMATGRVRLGGGEPLVPAADDGAAFD